MLFKFTLYILLSLGAYLLGENGTFCIPHCCSFNSLQKLTNPVGATEKQADVLVKENGEWIDLKKNNLRGRDRGLQEVKERVIFDSPEGWGGGSTFVKEEGDSLMNDWK